MEYDKITNEDTPLFSTVKEPRKAFTTFIRNQNKFYINSFNMIDRKAAIMIRVNASIISAIIIFFKHIQHLEYGYYMGISMVICSLVSLILAINASRPHIFSLSKHYQKRIAHKYPNPEENLFVVGNYDRISIEDYEKAYDKLLNKQELQIGNQIRAMYIFETRIRKSFIQIEISYASFMIGFVIVVIGFIYSNINHLF